MRLPAPASHSVSLSVSLAVVRHGRVVIKGRAGDEAVLCTANETYALRLAEATNTLVRPALPPSLPPSLLTFALSLLTLTKTFVAIGAPNEWRRRLLPSQDAEA